MNFTGVELINVINQTDHTSEAPCIVLCLSKIIIAVVTVADLSIVIDIRVSSESVETCTFNSVNAKFSIIFITIQTGRYQSISIAILALQLFGIVFFTISRLINNVGHIFCFLFINYI